MSAGKLLSTNTVADMGRQSGVTTTRTARYHTFVLPTAHPSFANLLTSERVTVRTVHLLLHLSAETLRHDTLITFTTLPQMAFTVTGVVTAHEGLVTDITTKGDGICALGTSRGQW